MDRQERYQRAKDAYYAGDRNRWIVAEMAWEEIGQYNRGGAQSLAAFIGRVSVDTLEHLAHSFGMYLRLFGVYGFEIDEIRNSPGVYVSHFLALYEIHRSYDLTHEVIRDMLDSVVSDNLSSRDLRNLARDRYGDERVISHEAGRARSALFRVLSRPDVPAWQRVTLQAAFEILEAMSTQQKTPA